MRVVGLRSGSRAEAPCACCHGTFLGAVHPVPGWMYSRLTLAWRAVSCRRTCASGPALLFSLVLVLVLLLPLPLPLPLVLALASGTAP